MSGPHIEDEWFSMTDDEIVRFMCGLRPEPVDPPRRGFHHEPPTTQAWDDDEGVGAEGGED